MPPKKKNDTSSKNKEKKKKSLIEDKTFGMKNKNKSSKVQKVIAGIKQNIEIGGLDAAGMRAKNAKLAAKTNKKLVKQQADEEMRLLFNEALASGKSQKEIDAERSAARKAKKDLEMFRGGGGKGSGGGGGGGGGGADFYDDAWAEAQLKAGIDVPEGMGRSIEAEIEMQREKMRAAGVKGTPVTEASLAAWKARKKQKREAENKKLMDAERLKRKGGKGLAVLSGRDLFAYDATLFKDDANAANKKEVEKEAVEDNDAEIAAKAAADNAAAHAEEDAANQAAAAAAPEAAAAAAAPAARKVALPGSGDPPIVVNADLYLAEADVSMAELALLDGGTS